MPRRGVLLVNLGSPDSTKVEDVKVYLREFLMDKNVIDVPYPIRKMVVELFILPRRPKQSAEAYRSMWWDGGSTQIVCRRHCQRARLKNPDVQGALCMV